MPVFYATGPTRKLSKGKIGLQVHGGNGFKGMKIIIKRMEIRPLAGKEQRRPDGCRKGAAC